LVGSHDAKRTYAHEVSVVTDCSFRNPVVFGGCVDDACVAIGKHVSRYAGQTLGCVCAGLALDRARLAQPYVRVGEHTSRTCAGGATCR